MYILGDLFEVWVGDDGADASALAVANGLRELSQQGSAVFFVHGNRDFLIGPRYGEMAGMQLLGEPVLLATIEPATALLHGDTLCTDDHDYQRFRRKVRDPAWQARMLSRPLWWRRLLARVARTLSRKRNRGKPADIMDVNPQAVARSFRELGIQRLVHGHTHRPGIHRLSIDGKPCERIVLGDWHGESGSVLRMDGDQACLMELRRDGTGAVELVVV